MKKVLGLDLGSSSIGWALIHQPEFESEKYHIAGMGVRIIPLSKDDADEFSKGNAISKNASRTLKRGIRRSMHRYKMRKQFLAAVFQSFDIMPPTELFMLSATELYGLRDKAVREQITLQEFARILFHLNQKRGYKSNRKANNEEGDETTGIKADENAADENEPKKVKKKGYLDLINDREELVKEQTIGQYFYKELLNNPFYRIKENIFMRKSYENEFDQIWKTQQQFYPDILTEANKTRIRDEIIYYQRPLKSQKGLVSVCPFEGKTYSDKRSGYQKDVFSGPKVVPKSSPLFQVSKIWQELNNVEITSFQAMKSRNKNVATVPSEFDLYGKRKLKQEEKQKLFEALNWGEKLTPKQILLNIGYSSGYNEYKINLRNEKFMEGNRTLADIKKVFDKFKVSRDELLQFNLKTDTNGRVDKEIGEVFYRIRGKEKKESPLNTFEDEPLYKLWHLIYSIEEAEILIKTLQTKFNLSNEVAAALSKLDFQKAGYGNMSARALRNILPHLMNGLGYSEACAKAGYNHSNSLTVEENTKREIQDKLELYPKNSLRQPVVEKIINQVINLINELIDEKNGFITNEERYAKDKFEIRIELARELKQSAKERNEAFSRNTQQDKRHKSIEEELRKYGFIRVSKNDIERYKLWEEFGKASPYEPTKVISLTEVFNQVPGVLYDIEHIIPKSRLFDDSFSNKTICPRALNSGAQAKNQMTAHDFMKSRGDQAYHDYVEFIKQHHDKRGITRSKFKKLMMPLLEIPDDFIDRQMNETRFISREIKGLLQKVCRNVHSSTGTVTSKLRHLWGWDNILMNLQIDKYREQGLTEWMTYGTNGQSHKVEKIIGWSKREDHRHHAIDALSVACTKQGFVQRINSLNAQHTRDEMFNETKDNFYSEKLTLLERYLAAQKPFDTATVQNASAKILVSFKAGKRVATKSVNKIKKGNEVVERRISLTPRGFLHKETIYGQIKQYEKVKISPRFDSLNETVFEDKKQDISAHLLEYNNDEKKAFNSKELAKFVDTYGYNEVAVYKKEAVVKYKLNGDFKEKDIPFIVDKGIQKIISTHLAKHGNNPKIAFNTENTVWMNKAKGIAIKSVRCKTGSDSLQSLHKNKYGVPIDFVSTRNNHHIAIYRDADGKLQENAVTFWDAFERKKAGLPIVIKDPKSVWDNILSGGFDEQSILSKLPSESWGFVTSLQQNEMFVFDLTAHDLQNAIDENNLSLINRHLYRVQKIAEGDYTFRHHLETSVDDKINGVKNESLSTAIGKTKRITSLKNMTGIKIKLDNLGRIVKVGE
jgi:CRISPR-associated endonuclease Csn1